MFDRQTCLKLMTTDTLLTLFIVTALVWYIQVLWKRRRLYKVSLSLPGPLALPLIGSVFFFIGNSHDIFVYLCRMFEHYPGIFRLWLGPRLFYAVSEPKYIEILLSSPYALRKANFYRFAAPIGGQGLVTALSVSHWKRHRKIIMPTFNQKILDRYMVVFAEQSEILNNIMEKYSGEKDVDISNLISRCTLDIICETAMGVKIKAQSTNPSFLEWVDKAMEIATMRILDIACQSDLVFKNTTLGKELYYVADMARSFTKQVLLEKRRLRDEKKIQNNGTPTKDEYSKRTAFLDLLMDQNSEGNSHFTDEELLDETITFMIAGSDTTATSNCFTLAMLGLHQDIQEKVLDEIIEVVGPTGSIELSHLPQLKYLERVIKESLRLFPIGAFIARSVDEDIDLGDHVVLKGTSILVGLLRVHTNEKYWPDPYKFDPDRFLPEEVAKRIPGSYIPFSYGSRNCIGPRYGMMAMKTLLATVLRKYRFYTLYKSVEDIELKLNIVLRPKDGFKVYFELRE